MHRIRTVLVAVLLAGVAPLASAATPPSPVPTPAPSTPAPSTSTTPVSPAPSTATTPAAAPTDAQIAHIAVMANTIDIETGNLAGTKTKNADVKSFAAMMVGDHTLLNKQATDLATSKKLTPADNDTSKALKKEHDATMTRLKALEGAAFDKAYVDVEIAFHQEVLDSLDKVLLVNVKDADLKALLTSARGTVAAHLQHAKDLQTKMMTVPLTH